MNASDAVPPQIWVDGDACPSVIKEILFRAAERERIRVTLVANQWLRCPPSQYIRALQVQGGFDVADSEIIERLLPGDLVVTQDIPLAAGVIEKGGMAINPRGERYTPDNMAERLSMRNFMEELRGAGVQTGGHPPFTRAIASRLPLRLTAGLCNAPRAAGRDRWSNEPSMRVSASDKKRTKMGVPSPNR